MTAPNNEALADLVRHAVNLARRWPDKSIEKVVEWVMHNDDLYEAALRSTPSPAVEREARWSQSYLGTGWHSATSTAAYLIGCKLVKWRLVQSPVPTEQEGKT